MCAAAAAAMNTTTLIVSPCRHLYPIRSCSESLSNNSVSQCSSLFCGSNAISAHAQAQFRGASGSGRGLALHGEHSLVDWKCRKGLRRQNRTCLAVRNVAFGPELSYELADGFNSWILPPAPEPVQFPRKSLNMKFAVLLMRSAYESVDALDFIPMDKFQVKFWKLRQREVEPYTLQNRPLRIKYGDLTDPLYFDFITFAQFATISNEMRTGEMVFKERLGSGGEEQVVRRDESLKDNSKLPGAFSRHAGDAIYQRLLEGFEGELFNAPPPCPQGSTFSCVVEGVKELLQAFVRQGYALKAVVDQVEPASDNRGGKLRVKVEGSATLWGLRTLVSRRALVLSNFDNLAVGGFLRASQRIASSRVRYSDTTVEELWTIA